MNGRALGLCAVVLMLGGCDGSGETSAGDNAKRVDRPVTRQALPKNQFRARGDAICADVQAELAPIVARVAKARAMPPSRRMTETEAIWRRQTQIVHKFRARFAALPPPKGDEPRMEELVRALDEGIRLSREIIGHLDSRREPPTELMREYAKVVYRGNALAQGYGFTVCGRTR